MRKSLPAFLLLSVLFLPVACENGFPFGHRTSAPVAPPNPSFVSVTITAALPTSYPATIAISPGGTVVFVNESGYDHTLQPDDGAGVCQTDNFLGNTTSVTLTFPGAGTYNYHCNYFGLCFDFACLSPCSGMAGIIIVQ